HHVGYGVADITAALAAIGATGVRLIDERPRHGAMGASIAFLHPADVKGVVTELVQAADPWTGRRSPLSREPVPDNRPVPVHCAVGSVLTCVTYQQKAQSPVRAAPNIPPTVHVGVYAATTGRPPDSPRPGRSSAALVALTSPG